MGELINGRTVEEIKAALGMCSEICFGRSDCPYYDGVNERCQTKLTFDSLALIERLESQIPKWISVEERLPEGEGSYLAYALGMEIVLDYNCYGEWWDDELNHYDGSVTHWMPLPEPPKEGE